MLARAENLVGQTIAGYRLLEVLGKGGMSLVFLAQLLDNPKDQVAIKVLMPSSIATPEEFISFQARFLREAQAAYRLHHEHILPVLGYGAADDIFYMIMPVITGGTLAELVTTRQSSLPLAEVAGYLNQLAGAIDYAHQHGFIHRDIKPSNVLLDEQGKAYLVDFGIVHLFDSGHYAVDEVPTSLTTTGKMYGTPAYMAPERFKGEQAEPATDIYALGILVYQLVTGQLPFKADNPLVVGMKHLNEMPPSPRFLRSDLPEPAEASILKALAKQPAERFATASAFAAAFGAGIKGRWAEGLLPLPEPVPVDTQQDRPVLAPIVPIPEGTYQPDQLVLGPALASTHNEAPVADGPTEVNPAPVAQPRSPSQARGRILLAGAILTGLVVLALLFLLAIGQLYSPPGAGKQLLPGGTNGVPVRNGVTPGSTTGVTPALSPRTTPTQRATPSPSPTTTPSPGPTPGKTPSPTPTTLPTPDPTPNPTP